MALLTVETAEFLFCPSRCGSEETDANSSDGETFTVYLPLTADSKCNYVERSSSDAYGLTGISDSQYRQDSSGGPDSLEHICTLGTGTFGRVVLSRHKVSQRFFALKILSIRSVVDSNQVTHVHWEKQILQQIDHPFIVRLHWAMLEGANLFMCLDYLPGGELFSYLRAYRRFTTDTAVFYAAEIILALEYLHTELSVAYRDLKPENLMLDREGHLKITDFGFAKVIKLGHRSHSCVGTPDYLAPEIIENSGHDGGVDWWALGVLIYEMLVGLAPFFAPTVTETCDLIVQCRLPSFPDHLSGSSKDLITKLLTKDVSERLGCGKRGAEEIKSHRWFTEINWFDVLNKMVEPPFVPQLKDDGDTGNFDEFDETLLDGDAEEPLEADLKLFQHW